MTSDLPAPGSIWIQKKYTAPMRVCVVDSSGIIAHDCELRMQVGGAMASWRGTPEEFAAAFVPGNPDLYPPTAR